MFALAKSLFRRLSGNFRQEEDPGARVDRRKNDVSSIHVHSPQQDDSPSHQKTLSNNDSVGDHQRQVLAAQAASTPSKDGPEEHFPRNPSDLHQAIAYLNQAASHALPAELLKVILYRADYDCIHFTAFSDHQMNVTGRSQLCPPARAYIETAPLTLIAPTFATADNSTAPAGRIRSLHLKISGRDQGWTRDSTAASWSWFEIGKKRFASDSIQRGPVLGYNTVAGRDWEDHEIYYHMDEEVPQKGVSEELKEWIGELRAEDRVVIVPMSKYGGWSRVSKASIDIEVEAWY